MNTLIPFSILAIYINFVEVYVKFEKLVLNNNSFIVYYCMMKQEIVLNEYTIPIGFRWEFISFNCSNHVMTLRSSKGYIAPYELNIQLLYE